MKIMNQNQKQKKLKSNYVKICPKCNSLDIYQETSGVSSNIIFGIPTQYRCRNCGFSGYIFPEVDISKIGDHKLINSKKDSGFSEAKTSQGCKIKKL